METIIDIKKANLLLKLFEKSKVSILLFKATLKRFYILIENAYGMDDKLVFVSVGSNHFSGLLTFESDFLKIEESIKFSNNALRIYDGKKDFEILFDGGFTLLRLSKIEFNESIESILK